MAAFPTAPASYGRLLQVETAAFDLPFVRRRLRQADGDGVEGEPSNTGATAWATSSLSVWSPARSPTTVARLLLSFPTRC